ncbi:HMA2 domain-containing protein [Solidesulfovibrio sp.]|uniref:HMA2 domain-containing protein n=1 Tax=Solidesulfovibrio sp. TaxID=2910990 RepID=UPI00261C909F|nr:heavy-metal-associated domain-containing protein [Solidesulfovibrio sp.]
MIASRIEGRIRFRHPILTDPETIRAVAEQVAVLPGITGVEGNPRTGSLLVTHDASVASDDLVAMAEAMAAKLAPEQTALPASRQARPGLRKGQLKRRTQKIGLATCMAGAVATGLADTKSAHLAFGLGLAGFAAWHLFMFRRRFLA